MCCKKVISQTLTKIRDDDGFLRTPESPLSATFHYVQGCTSEVCVFLEGAAPVRGSHVQCSIYSRTLKVSYRHILTKGRGTRGCPCVCVLMRDWHHAREASLAEECGSRQIDCSFAHSISLSTTIICLSRTLHCMSTVFMFFNLCVFHSFFVFPIKEVLKELLHFECIKAEEMSFFEFFFPPKILKRYFFSKDLLFRVKSIIKS